MSSLLNPAVPAGAYEVLVDALPAARAQRA
jgi:hypothetical protein